MTLYAYTDSPFFAAGTDVHTTDGIQLLWDNTRLLDMATLAPRDLFTAHTETRHERNRQNPLRFWQGGFRYRTGLTTLGLYVDRVTTGESLVTPKIRVTCNGVTRIDSTLASGVNLYSVGTMASWGLTDGQVVEVVMEIYDAAAPTPSMDETAYDWGTYYLVDAHVSPASGIIADAYPGVPSFVATPAGNAGPTQAKLLQLGNAADWLARRVNACAVPLFQRMTATAELPYWPKDPYPDEPARHLWSGGLIRGPFDRIYARVVWVTGSATNQRIRMLINGSEVATTGNLSASSWGFYDFAVNVSGYGATTVLRVELELVITAGVEQGGWPTRISVEWVEAGRNAAGFQTLTNRPTPYESTTWAVRRARLNDIATWLTAIKSRIDADVDRWDRIRLYRSSYAYNPGEAEILQGRYWAVRRRRTGARLIVRGSNVKIGWGPLSYKLANPDEPFGEYLYSWGYEETLISGNEVQTKEIFLDTLTGLLPGMTYVLSGWDVRYAGEELR